MDATAFTLGTKGLQTATALASGELLIVGYLTRWDELDREGDRMVRGAFSKAVREFNAGLHKPFCYAHRLTDVLGTVLAIEEDHIGLKMVAKVNRQPESSRLRWVYEAIKNKTIAGLSVGGRFLRRRRYDGTNEIYGVEVIEASATATPVLASTGFEIVSEGKALELWGEDPLATAERAVALAELAVATRELQLAGLALEVARL
jgi:HK97 family phage prohead protease